MLRALGVRRWLLRLVAGLVLVTACVQLGRWQLDRNEQRAERNAVIEANVSQSPVAISEVTEVDGTVSRTDEWTPVSVTGRYDPQHQLALRLRPVEGRNGFHVLTPLVTDAGAVLVDRGFLPSRNADVPDLPAPPSGEVSVVGRVRPSEDGRGTGGDPATGAVRFVHLEGIESALPYPLYGGWLELISEDPPTSDNALQLIPPPEAEPGPHLSYAIQWFAFAVIGVGGFVLLVRAEMHARREDEDAGQPVRATPDREPR